MNDVSRTIEQGEIVTLIGPNGSRRTTLLRAALGLVKPFNSRVRRRLDLRIGAVRAEPLLAPQVADLSGGELQRVLPAQAHLAIGMGDRD